LKHPDHEAEASDGRYRNDRPNAERENEKCHKLGSTPDMAFGGRQCGGVLGAVMHGAPPSSSWRMVRKITRLSIKVLFRDIVMVVLSGVCLVFGGGKL
jgi:hypothetical protein